VGQLKKKIVLLSEYPT